MDTLYSMVIENMCLGKHVLYTWFRWPVQGGSNKYNRTTFFFERYVIYS